MRVEAGLGVAREGAAAGFIKRGEGCLEEGARRGGGVSVADTAAASGVLAEENTEMGRRLGWASARSGAARIVF